MFGRDGQPAHRYTMRQAIEEEFILDVLKHYTTYATYFKQDDKFADRTYTEVTMNLGIREKELPEKFATQE